MITLIHLSLLVLSQTINSLITIQQESLANPICRITCIIERSETCGGSFFCQQFLPVFSRKANLVLNDIQQNGQFGSSKYYLIICFLYLILHLFWLHRNR